jgi:hypothetical protein
LRLEVVMSHFVEIAKIIAEAAPTLASTFLGPYANIALNLVSKAIGMAGAQPQEIGAALKATDWTAKLAQLESNHAPWLTLLSGVKMPSKVSVSIEIEFPTAS